MRPAHVSIMLDEVITAALERREYTVVFLHGPPGSAKSALVNSAAMRHGMGFADVRLSIKDTVDLTGVPRVDEHGRTIFAPPGWLPKGGKWIIFLDEYPQAMMSMQNVGGQLIYDRKAGDYEVPADCIIVLAGNRQQDRAGTTQTPQQINNRCVHIDVVPYWPDVQEHWIAAGYDPRVIYCVDLLERKGESILCVPSKDAPAFPSLRTWQACSNILGMNLPTVIRNEMLEGAVGKGAANELIGFVDEWDNGLRYWREALSNPRKAPLPDKASAQYALVLALARNADMDNLSNIVAYLGRLPSREMGTLCLTDAARHSPVLKEHPAYSKWMLANA